MLHIFNSFKCKKFTVHCYTCNSKFYYFPIPGGKRSHTCNLHCTVANPSIHVLPFHKSSSYSFLRLLLELLSYKSLSQCVFTNLLLSSTLFAKSVTVT